ncbi:uncharacterized protein LOC113272387 [Papaver somniferum]|uniref:uncharacterized protein LOC113272387 n=1 Tax=Papaver somniferum TaxID=3469 RepID=UPI000E704514|nr:uncharacterized protein LOC113272387 [Papaver somniferum]
MVMLLIFFMQKLKNLKHILKEWNWKVFGDLKVKIQEAEQNVKATMETSDHNPRDEQALHDLVNTQNELNSRETQYNTMLQKKSRIKWVKEGSANTAFFHSNIKIRQTRNTICELEDENENLISDQKKIADILVDFFEKRFQAQDIEVNEDILDVIQNVITESDQFMLEVIPEADEIKAVVFDMDGDSAPGPDSVSGMFYKACWDIIQQDFINVIQYCWRRRMACLMHKLVSPQQVAYIKGRNIHEQILLASELVNEMKKKRRGGNLSLKLDISQAYDSGAQARRSTISILFVLIEEVLSGGLTKLVETRKLQPMVTRDGIAPTHILFADDIFLFNNCSKRSIENLLNLIETYQNCSGQIINKNKNKNLGIIIHPGRIKSASVCPMVEIMQDYLAVWKGDADVRKFKTISWRRVCTPFCEGGLGIRRLSDSLKNDVRWILGNGEHISVWFDIWTGDCPIIEKIGFTDYVNNNIQMKVKDLLQNNEWVIPTELKNFISLPLPIISGAHDNIIWSGDIKGNFPTTAAVNKVRHKEQKIHWPSHIWKSFLHPGISSNIWKIQQGVFIDDQKKITQGYDTVSMCCVCKQDQEELNLLPLECCWLNPPKNFVLFCCDGAAAGNPGLAGFGVIARDHDCAVIGTVSGGL